MRRAVGVVPAAGRGSRMWPYRAPKELVQVGYETVTTGDGESALVPTAAVEHTLRAMRRGGVDRALLVLSPTKPEILTYLGSGAHQGMRLGYLCQEEPRGMPDAIDLARPFIGDQTTCMGMADTVVKPADCFAQLLAFHQEHRADLSLGVFDTDDPQTLAPVVLDPRDGRVRDIVDKPESPPAANTWGTAVWSPAFTELLHDFASAPPPDDRPEPLLSDAFMLAVRSGLRVFGLPFESGSYHDLGSPDKLMRARARLELPYYLDAGQPA